MTAPAYIIAIVTDYSRPENVPPPIRMVCDSGAEVALPWDLATAIKHIVDLELIDHPELENV